MDNLRSVLSIVLSKIPPGEILNHKIPYDDITKEKFVQLAGYYVKNYSNDELENLFYYIRDEYEERADYFKGFGKIHTKRDSFNIFDAILIFAVRTLQEIDGEPVCQYGQMLRWRMTSHELDEDVFTTAFLAYQDVRYERKNRNFSWRPVIKHNNEYLNKVLAQGMADNHFHLKGSAPQFPLSWISMMNNVTSKKFHEQLERYSKKRLSVVYMTEGEDHLYISYLKAALIRCFLFSKLTKQPFILMKGVDYEGQMEDGERTDDAIVESLLKDRSEILFFRKQVQQNIRMLKINNFSGAKTELDYAMCRFYSSDKNSNPNDILSGERWFLYHMFRLVFSKNHSFQKYYNMFYAYLVIKETIRSELVQTNANIGFDNFANYQDRKEDFIEGTPFEKPYVEMAVKGTLNNQNILALEARIAPRDTSKSNRDYIRKFDGILASEELQKRYFYVFHFIKEKDCIEGLGKDIYCRHYAKRKKLKRQAIAITRFRERYPKEARRVRGIDACSKEIGCRPEVFSQTYRFLSNHIVYLLPNEDGNVKPVHQLAMTYHVGEDYVDILDGLRAVDEAVCFLKLDCGSRLGHGLALGLDVDEYYRGKNNRILIKQQDYLDNLVWLYYRIKKFGLRHYDDLLLFIEQEYSKYFRKIYGNFVCDDFFHKTMSEAREHFRDGRVDRNIVEGYCNTNFYFRISEYYAAWKLRGDAPECYKHGYFQEAEDFSEWNHYAVNRSYPEDYKVRYNPECAYLYYLYHYCGEAKKEGEKVIEARPAPRLSACVKEVQREMRKWLAKLGIGIETNPSSNYLVGSFRRYDKHPIFDFYNIGLTSSQDELDECPQLPVCINTDDQGIFSTYLENEYALLALALEKAKDENGKDKYNRTMVYQWIDNVRKLGLNLSFSENLNVL